MRDGVVLAVDGGNTKTVALVAGPDGRVLGAGRAGNADVYSAGSEEIALGEVERAARAALAAAGADGADVRATVFSLAGADWPEDFALHRREAVRRLGIAEPLVLNDAIGALRCGTPDAVGVAAVSGTGGAVGARRADGTIFHLGFWPAGCGGEEIGRQALRAIEEAALDLGPATALAAPILAVHGVGEVIDLLRVRYRREGPPPARPRDLAGIVLSAADQGDPVARRIVHDAGARLGDYALVCARRLEMADQRYPLVLAGGLLRHPSRLLEAAIGERHPNGVAVRATLEPAGGALLWALDLAGVTIDPEAVRSTLPADVFVSTAAPA